MNNFIYFYIFLAIVLRIEVVFSAEIFDVYCFDKSNNLITKLDKKIHLIDREITSNKFYDLNVCNYDEKSVQEMKRIKESNPDLNVKDIMYYMNLAKNMANVIRIISECKVLVEDVNKKPFGDIKVSINAKEFYPLALSLVYKTADFNQNTLLYPITPQNPKINKVRYSSSKNHLINSLGELLPFVFQTAKYFGSGGPVDKIVPIAQNSNNDNNVEMNVENKYQHFPTISSFFILIKEYGLEDHFFKYEQNHCINENPQQVFQQLYSMGEVVQNHGGVVLNCEGEYYLAYVAGEQMLNTNESMKKLGMNLNCDFKSHIYESTLDYLTTKYLSVIYYVNKNSDVIKNNTNASLKFMQLKNANIANSKDIRKIAKIFIQMISPDLTSILKLKKSIDNTQTKKKRR